MRDITETMYRGTHNLSIPCVYLEGELDFHSAILAVRILLTDKRQNHFRFTKSFCNLCELQSSSQSSLDIQ